MAISRKLARPMLSVMFFAGASSALKNADALAAKASRVTDRVGPRLRQAGVPVPQDDVTVVKLNAAVQIAAASALALGRAPRLSSTVLAASLVPTTVAGHPFWAETDPAAKQQQKLQFAKNVSVLGGLLLAALDTEGRPGVAWRTRHAVGDVARSSRHLAREKSLEARLAAKSL
jgi:uncharacterized membrane protein YphA (DoxX/SURF4 family)